MKIILAGGILGFIVITTAFKSIKGKLSRRDMVFDLKVIIDAKEVCIKAMLDTGNLLRDPISKSPVVVVEKEVMYKAIDKKILDNLENIVDGEDIELEDWTSKIRLIPFSSLGKENGLLIGVKSDAVSVYYEDKKIYIKNAIIGIYNGKLSKNNRYNALIGLELLESKGGIENENFAVTKG